MKRRVVNTKVMEMGELGYSPINAPMNEGRKSINETGAMMGARPVDFAPPSLAREMVRYTNAPINEIVTGRILDNTMTISTISPILGNYAGRQSFPDDWGQYWEYLHASLLVPEISYALKLKSRLAWSSGWKIVSSDDKLTQKIERRLRFMRFEKEMRLATGIGYMMGNFYLNLVTNGDYTYVSDEAGWHEDQPATKLFGFKHLDPRTMRRFVHPWNYDISQSDIEVLKYIQRAYSAPLGNAPYTALLQNKKIFNEIPIYPPLMMHGRFNRVMASLYGYSTMRETITALKGYLVMQQFIPLIFQKRGDPLLHIRFGGNVYTGSNSQITIMPRTRGQLEQQKGFLETRNPGDDLFTDFLTVIDEVYKSPSPIRGLDQLLIQWTNRVWHGLNIPVTGAQWEMQNLIHETQEVQDEIAELVNRQVIPLLTSREVEFQFNDLVPDDWMAKSRVVLQLFQGGVINGEWSRLMLEIPEEAGKGAQPFQTWGKNPTFGTPPGGAFPQGNPNKLNRKKSPKAKPTPNYPGLSTAKDKGARREILD